MKKIILLSLIFLFCAINVFADRDTATVSGYSSSQLIKRGDAKIYSISFVATSNGGNFVIYDALTETKTLPEVKAEGSEATANNSQYQDFTQKPLEFSTGLYLAISNGYIIISYE